MKILNTLLVPVALTVTFAACYSTGPERLPAADAPAYEAPAPAEMPPAPPPPMPAVQSSAGDLKGWLAVPTGNKATSAILLEKFAPGEVAVGETFDITLVVTNLTTLGLNNVVVANELAPTYKLASTNPTAAMTDIRAGRWNVGSLPPGASRTVTLTGSASQGGTMSTCAGVTYDTAMCMVTNVVEPRLQLVAAGPAEVMLCDAFDVRYTVSNPGSGTARNVVVNVSYPTGLTDSNGRSSGVIQVGTLAGGQSKTMSVRLRSDRRGTFSYGATANASGNLSAKSGTVSTTIRQPELAVTAKSPSAAFIGRDARFEITIANNGDTVAKDTIVESPVPSGMSFVSATDGGRVSQGKVVWLIGDLAPRTSRTLQVVHQGAGPGMVQSTATVKAICANPAVAPLATEVRGIPAVLLEVVDIADPVLVGDNETYVISVTNQGSAPATGIRITATLPPNTTFVTGSGVTGGSAQGARVTFAPLPSLASKATASWTVIVKGVSPADARFRVTMSSNELGTVPVEETESTTYYE